MATYTLDITNEHSPMTFVRTILKLSQIAKDDILEVFLSEGEPLENVPRSAEEQGFKILKLEHVEGSIHKVTIQK